MWPLGQSHFWPHGCNVNNLGKGPLNKTKYQMSKAKIFKLFPHMSMYEVTFQMEPFWPQGHNLNIVFVKAH